MAIGYNPPMKKMKYIDPSHVWDIRHAELGPTAKALLNRLLGLQHLTDIYFSNQALADDLGVTKQTIVSKMKLLTNLGYIASRKELNTETQTKFTELNLDFIRQQIITTAPKKRRQALAAYYTKQLLDDQGLSAENFVNAM